ncbi:unnamed protein product [Chrysoparadoxa australica]
MPDADASSLASLSPASYLSKFQVTEVLEKAILQLVELRPRDPLQFLSDYVGDVISGANPLTTETRLLREATGNREQIKALCHPLYTRLASRRGSKRASWSDLWGVIQALCCDLSNECLGGVLTVMEEGGPHGTQGTGAGTHQHKGDVVNGLSSRRLGTNSLPIDFGQFVAAVHAVVLFLKIHTKARAAFVGLAGDPGRAVPLVQVLQALHSTESGGECDLIETLRERLDIAGVRGGETKVHLGKVSECIFRMCMFPGGES